MSHHRVIIIGAGAAGVVWQSLYKNSVLKMF